MIRNHLWAMVVAVGAITCACGSGHAPSELHPSGQRSGASTTPAGYQLHGTLSAPSCQGGYAIDNASVTIRNEKNEVVASTTTRLESSVQPQTTTNTDLEARRQDLYAKQEPIADEITQINLRYPNNGYQAPAGSADASRVAQLREQEQPLVAQLVAISAQIEAVRTSAGAKASNCVVHFSADIPTAQFYQIKVGTHDAPIYSFDELQARGFAVELSLK